MRLVTKPRLQRVAGVSYVRCPVCLDLVSLRRDGLIRKHRAAPEIRAYAPTARCYGSGGDAR